MKKNKLKAQDKVDILKITFLPLMKERISDAYVELEQAKKDWLNLYSADGDKSKVKKNPILSVIDGQVSVEMIGKLMADVERMLNE